MNSRVRERFAERRHDILRSTYENAQFRIVSKMSDSGKGPRAPALTYHVHVSQMSSRMIVNPGFSEWESREIAHGKTNDKR